MGGQGQGIASTKQLEGMAAALEQCFTWPVSYIPQKIVSLVPSITESIIELGFGDALLGITSYCPEPMGERRIERVGGPATIDIERIVRLAPDLIIAGLEENSPLDLFQLVKRGIPVWIVFPTTVDETIWFLYQLSEGFRSKQAFLKVRSIEQLLEYVRSSWQEYSPDIRYFCPIWYEVNQGQDVWMVFDDRTYAANLLSLFGAKNCFGRHDFEEENQPAFSEHQKIGIRDTRYDKICTETIIHANPNLILLPSEPYPFDRINVQDLKQKFCGVTAVERNAIKQIDGKLIFWYGTRLGQALQRLPFYFTDFE
ncbi:MAG: hypothetical protein DDG59_09990 [Anaerolineae bacterium]|jgi:ABC-type hemin transport system substrate-binding protein|nr:MAG: hypothetical protein DDG59_09990 [Anaerolineae bacterium]